MLIDKKTGLPLDSVQACNNCPLSWWRFPPNGPFICHHPTYLGNGRKVKEPDSPDRGRVTPPGWCPLKEGPVTVRLQLGDEIPEEMHPILEND